MVELLEDFAKIFFDLVCIPFLTEPEYLRGFGVALLLALLVGQVARALLYARGQWNAYFASVQPSLKPSPSPYARTKGCFISVVIVGLFCSGTSFFLWAFTYALSRYGG